MVVSAFRTFQLYVSIKKHFSSLSYDVVKNNGKVSVTENILLKRRDRGLFEVLGRMCDTPSDVSSFLVANIAYGNDYPFANFDESWKKHEEWQTVRQSLYKIFEDDLKIIFDYLNKNKLTFEHSYAIIKPNIPILFKLLLSKQIHIESVVILNYFEEFLDSWMKAKHLALWKKDFLKIKKLSAFMKVNVNKFEKILEKIKGELKVGS